MIASFKYKCHNKNCSLHKRPIAIPLNEWPLHCACGAYQESPNSRWIKPANNNEAVNDCQPCDKAPAEFTLETKTFTMPSLAKRAYNYAQAYTKHALAGYPECNQAEIDTRLAICKSCPAYTGELPNDASACMLCGCYVNSYLATEAKNKLAWADSHCPWKEDGVPQPKWPRVDGQPTENWNANNPHYNLNIITRASSGN